MICTVLGYGAGLALRLRSALAPQGALPLKGNSGDPPCSKIYACNHVCFLPEDSSPAITRLGFFVRAGHMQKPRQGMLPGLMSKATRSRLSFIRRPISSVHPKGARSIRECRQTVHNHCNFSVTGCCPLSSAPAADDLIFQPRLQPQRASQRSHHGRAARRSRSDT
jgi:hypothetical protein